MNRPNGYSLATVGVILAAAATYLVGGGSVHLWDRDEAWYAQASRQMVDSGNWLVTYFLDQPRYAKPILIYWCQAACMTMLGVGERAVRLPSAIAMIITLSILAWSIGRAAGMKRAFYTVLIFGSSLMVIVSAKMCLTDSVLLTFMTVAQLCLFAIYRGGARGVGGLALPLIFWVCVALAGLTKGPIVLAVLIAAMLVLACLEVGGLRRWSLLTWRDAVSWWGRLRPLLGLLVILAVVGPWLVAVGLRDPEFLRNMLLEPVRHTARNQDGQWALPGYYVAIIWLVFFPWSPLLPPVLHHAWRRRRARHIRFALALVVGNWLLGEVMATKLPHYLLPAFASLAFLTTDCLRHGLRRPFVRMMIPGTVLWLIGAAALAAGPVLLDIRFSGPRMLAVLPFVVLAAGYLGIVGVMLVRRRLPAAVVAMGLGMLLIATTLYGVFLPGAWYLRMPAAIGRTLRVLGATREGEVIMVGFFEPSLAFYQGGTIRERPADFLVRTPVCEWPRWIVATEGLHGALPSDKLAGIRVVERFHGLNYNAAARSDLYSRVSATQSSYSTIATRDGNEYKSLLKAETVLILERVAPRPGSDNSSLTTEQ